MSMVKHTLCMDWLSLDGARKKKRKLSLEADDDGVYICPVQNCLHIGYKSQRGLRKHINTKHEWYLYFDKEPTFNRAEAVVREKVKLKASTHNKPAFSINQGCGRDFAEWLETSCGGGKNTKEAKQVAKRAMKFLMFSLGDCESGVSAQDSYIDCCVASPQMLMKFLKCIAEEWGLKSTGALSYLQAVEDLCDYRKCQGIPDTTLRLLSITEVYIRRSKSTLYKKRNVEYSRDLTLEKLIARDSWASLENMEKVIPYHSPKYEYLVKKTGAASTSLTVSELAFTTRFIITFLFLRVKCTRPMSLQYLTLDMIKRARENNGFVDQTEFKTNTEYIFDSLKFSPSALDIINSFITNIRPLCQPKCEYVITTTKGNQYTAFGNAMSLLVHQAIDKHITPTRYRQIVESESVERLSPEQQAVISKDQKHSSIIARRCYQKKLSREIALEGAEAMKELVGEQGGNHTKDLASKVRVVVENVAIGDDDTTKTVVASEQSDSNETAEPTSDNGITSPIVIDESEATTTTQNEHTDPKLTAVDDIELKKEELEEEQKKLLFSQTEDGYLRSGVVKYGNSSRKWADILKDDEYKFHPSRTRDALRMRATTLKLGKEKTKKKSHR